VRPHVGQNLALFFVCFFGNNDNKNGNNKDNGKNDKS
jgi:hypothetical protein